jgi:hypothetical protein
MTAKDNAADTHDVTDVPTFYFNNMRLFNLAELRTLFFVARHTLGKGVSSARISTSDFIGGYPAHRQGGTGLSKSAQIESLKRLVEFGVLIELKPNDSSVNEGKEWALQLEEGGIDLAALRARHGSKKARCKKRTRATVEANRRYPKIDFTPPSTGRSPGFVYLMKGVYGYKIGRSLNPLKRANSLHNILLAWHPVEDAEKAEKQLHEMFERVRVRDEYFDLTDGDLSQLMSTLNGNWVML